MTETKKSLRAKLLEMQVELRVPKSQRNSFGNYNYRSCEDILEALKPILAKHKVVLTIGDKIVKLGERYYVKAQAEIKDIESDTSIFVYAYAREEEVKKGMDGSQITGSSSSYARKYALNGLFGIDDTKDSDFTNKHETKIEKVVGSDEDAELKVVQHQNPMIGSNLATAPQVKLMFRLGGGSGVPEEDFKDLVKERFSLDSLTKLTKSQASEVIDKLQKGEAI